MTFKEYLRNPQPRLDALADHAEVQRCVKEEYHYSTRADRRQTAYAKYHKYINIAKDELAYARTETDHVERLEALNNVAHWRTQAMGWYSRYQKVKEV